MELIYCPALDEAQGEGVWQLLEKYGEDFVPPLSRRESTCQQGLQLEASSASHGPQAYFAEMRGQHFVLAMENGRVAGFLTFRYGHIPDILSSLAERDLLGLYITTIIVDGAFRRQGLARGFYARLMALFPRERRLISTRTWSSNISHISLLEKLGFAGPVRIPNDRGPGIDTVYYYKTLEAERHES